MINTIFMKKKNKKDKINRIYEINLYNDFILLKYNSLLK